MKKQQALQKKSPAWKRQYTLKAQLMDQAIERGVRMHAMATAAQAGTLGNMRDLIRDSEMAFQWLMYGKKPPTLSVVDMSSGVPGDEGC